MSEITGEGRMTPAQDNAIRALERALKKCKDAGVRIYGMDDNLRAYPQELLDAVSKGPRPTAHEIAEGTEDYFQGENINDHGAYCDSGGW